MHRNANIEKPRPDSIDLGKSEGHSVPCGKPLESLKIKPLWREGNICSDCSWESIMLPWRGQRQVRIVSVFRSKPQMSGVDGWMEGGGRQYLRKLKAAPERHPFPMTHCLSMFLFPLYVVWSSRLSEFLKQWESLPNRFSRRESGNCIWPCGKRALPSVSDMQAWGEGANFQGPGGSGMVCQAGMVLLTSMNLQQCAHQQISIRGMLNQEVGAERTGFKSTVKLNGWP